MLLLTIGLALVFSSPDDKPVTIAQWATAAPKDFLATAVSELNGTSGVATYGPPYTNVPGAGQNIIGHLSIERLLGVQIPIDPAPRVRDRAADDPGSHRPDTRGGAAAVGSGLTRAEARLGEPLREGARPGQGGRTAESFTRATTGRYRH